LKFIRKKPKASATVNKVSTDVVVPQDGAIDTDSLSDDESDDDEDDDNLENNENNVIDQLSKTAPPTCGHLDEDVTSTVFTSFELDRYIMGTNLLTKFHEDRTINEASNYRRTDDVPRPVTKAHLSNQETNVLSKFHGNWAKNVTSTVFTCFHYILIEKNAPLTGGHVFSPIPIIFKLPNRENCHYIHIENNAPPTGGHFFSPISTIFELVRDIN
ncbi:hypothetical protein DPMN_071875, partial [Dreissena polymorpha]